MNPSRLSLGMLAGGVIVMILTVPLSMIATGAVQGTVDDLTVRNAENTWESEDWLTSVSYRDYYAYGVTNSAALNDFPAGWSLEPEFELLGPFTYKMTTYRTFIDYVAENGTYEYNESTEYESCFSGIDCDDHGPGEDPNTQVANLNIPYATLRVASVTVAFQMVRDGSEARFANLMLVNDMLEENGTELEKINSIIGKASNDTSWFDDNTTFDYLLHGGDDTDDPRGLLAEGEEPIYFGVRNFVDEVESDKTSAMEEYGITDESAMDSLLTWAGDWLNNESVYEVSSGNENETTNITAGDYANMSFGGIDPITGEMPLFSLNHGGFAPLPEGTVINLGNEKGGEMLDQMTEITGAAGVVYMAITGKTPPRVGAEFGPGGIELNSLIGLTSGYTGGDVHAAYALEHFTMSVLYNDLIPRYLSSIGADRWATHSVNEWLFGWHDSAAAFSLAGDAEDYTTGWFSLDTNTSYYVSPELAALNVVGPENDPTNYVRNTGEHDITQVGRLISQNGKTELDWRSEEMYIGTYGLIGWEQDGLLGVSGGWIEGTNVNCDDNPTVKYNLGGYVVADIPCVGTEDVKGIETLHYEIVTDPTVRNIQANLLNSKTLLDALPGSIPIYFGADVDFYAEPVSGAIIKGDVESTFYLDIAALNNPSKEPPTNTSEMQAVFIINDNPELSDDAAETVQSKIYQNMNFMSWWTNFDTPFDMAMPVLYLIGIALISYGLINLRKESALNSDEQFSHDTSDE